MASRLAPEVVAALESDRRSGLSMREIEERRKVPAATVHRVVRGVELPRVVLEPSGGAGEAVRVHAEGLEAYELNLAVYRALAARGFEVEVVGG